MRPSIRAAALAVLLSGVSAQGGYCQPNCTFMHSSVSNGLSEDGYRYDKTDPFSLSHDSVYSVFEDSSGKIWVVLSTED